jgi:6-phosphogluconolactonase
MEWRIYVGTYTGPGKADGIYVLRLDAETGALALLHTVRGIDHPSFLALDRQQRVLYAANELSEHEGAPSGALSAFAVDAASGNLTFLNHQPTHGTAPCYVSLDPSEQFVLAANYGNGVLTVLPVEPDGRLRPASDVVRHEGRSSDPRRQEGPHAHSVLPTPDGRYVFSCDLGLDRVLVYRLDTSAGKLVPNDLPYAQVSSGAGPRHIAFHPNGRFVYVNNEIDSTLTVFDYDAERGALQVVQTVSTLPDDFAGRNSTAQVAVHPSGRFVYVSNRGHDSIAMFAVNPESGRLRSLGHEPTQGRTPRNFTLDPTGAWLLAANQNTGNVVSFRIDQDNGRLVPAGQRLDVPAPVCLAFARA